VGDGNYNGGFISFGTRGWRGLTMQHNFTWSKALGTGAVDPLDRQIKNLRSLESGCVVGHTEHSNRFRHLRALFPVCR
jgi:hypothetical protein